ncbi:hypothetical protein OCU04_001864 [Sclerotinia nivalis]|uniref:Uncharacterized protein n=1 Tax=Sclerotinia nivalis TaxID=352851 RepID=A0A9X0DR07_9HELO|nr:hypothetical protein OCU04_001864 [Sclerotinia nivalis]
MVICYVFGAAPQNPQVADLLAAALAPLNTVVIVPDLFNGKAVQVKWYTDASGRTKAAKAAFVEFLHTIERWESLRPKLWLIVERNGMGRSLGQALGLR